MASPQCENGYTKFANELLEAIVRLNIGTLARALFWIGRQTYGWQKKEMPKINAYAMSLDTGMSYRQAKRAFASLRQSGVVTDNGIQKDYEKWKQAPGGDKKDPGQKRPYTRPSRPLRGGPVVPMGGSRWYPYKEKEITKEIVKKTTTAPSGAEGDQIVPHQESLTGIQRIMRGYKVAKGLDPNDKAWDKANFQIYCKAAKKLLEAFSGDSKKAMLYLIGVGYDFDEKDLKWNLATVAKWAWDDARRLDDKRGNGGELGGSDDAGQMGADRSLDQGRSPRITQAGSLAQEALRALRLHSGGGDDPGDEYTEPPDPILARED